jgi:hypothetical protein
MTMPIDEIYYHKSAEGVNRLGLHSWKKFGARYTIIDGESREDAKKELMQFVDENIRQQNIPEPEPEIRTQPLDEDGKTIAEIMLCKDLNKLKQEFELLSGKNKTIKAAYNNRLKQLQNNGLEQY